MFHVPIADRTRSAMRLRRRWRMLAGAASAVLALLLNACSEPVPEEIEQLREEIAAEISEIAAISDESVSYSERDSKDSSVLDVYVTGTVEDPEALRDVGLRLHEIVEEYTAPPSAIFMRIEVAGDEDHAPVNLDAISPELLEFVDRVRKHSDSVERIITSPLPSVRFRPEASLSDGVGIIRAELPDHELNAKLTARWEQIGDQARPSDSPYAALELPVDATWPDDQQLQQIDAVRSLPGVRGFWVDRASSSTEQDWYHLFVVGGLGREVRKALTNMPPIEGATPVLVDLEARDEELPMGSFILGQATRGE